MNDDNNESAPIDEIPPRIIEHFEEHKLEHEVLSLYLCDKNISTSLKAIEGFESREIEEKILSDTEKEKDEIIRSNQMVIDYSVKMWPRLVGNFSLEELQILLNSKLFVDVKVFALKEISTCNE